MPKVPKKALKVSAEIDIHAVSCPGVILLSRGRVALSVCLLGFHTRTGRMSPKFPLEFREKFKFDRTFVSVTNLSVLERVLEGETVYLELIQEEPTGETVLAVFESSVRDLLFPRQAERLSYSGNDLDLLMEPTRDFPGIISPKIEVSTRTVVGETRAPLHQCTQDNVSFGHSHDKTMKAVYKPITDGSGRDSDLEKDIGSVKRAEPIRSGDLRPPFAYKKPENSLLSDLPSSPPGNKYLGIRSRYLSKSTGNITDLAKPLESESIPKPNLHGSFGSLPKFSRGKYRSEDIEDAKVSLIEPERCPHCDEEHGPESCTSCRTYHRMFPRPSHQRPHIHSHAYHAHPYLDEAALKVLQQPPHPNRRRRKRYLVDIGSMQDLELRGSSPIRRPYSAPPTGGHGSGISGDEDDDDEDGDDERVLKDGERKGRSARKDRKRLSFSRSASRSASRSPSPPPSYASAPPALARTRTAESEEESLKDCYCFYPRRYGKYMHPHYLSPYYSYDYECPLCNPGYPRISKYSKWMMRYPYLCCDVPKQPFPSSLYHSKETCPICYKYLLNKPYYPSRISCNPCCYSLCSPFGSSRYRMLRDNVLSRYDSDVDDSPDTKRPSKGPKVKFKNKEKNNHHAVESADEILSDVYISSHD